MDRLFLSLYDYFRNRRLLLFLFILLTGLIAFVFASRLQFEEDITKMVSGGDNNNDISSILEQTKLLDRIIINVTLADTNKTPEPEILIQSAEKLYNILSGTEFQPYISDITFRIPESAMTEVYDIVYRNLPIFLDAGDYAILDSLTTPNRMREALVNSYNTLLSPAGFTMKAFIIRDPIGFSAIAMDKFSAFRNDNNYTIIDGCIFSEDNRNLLLFLTTAFPSNATSENTVLIHKLDQTIQKIESESLNEVKFEYFGSSAVAVGNSERLKKDIRLTLSITIFILLLIITFSIRKKKLLPFIFLPAIFGGLIALAIIYLIQAKVSVISLSIGTVVLAITVDYSLHITTHYKHKHSIIETIKDVSFPIIVCGIATAAEFLSLVFVSSASLNELGILAAISVLTASIFTLVVMPHILDLTKSKKDIAEEKNHLERILDKITRYNFHANRPIVILMVVFTILTWFYIDKVEFESDMMKMNYVSEKLSLAEKNLNRINDSKLNSIYIVARGKDLQEALGYNGLLMEKVNKLIQDDRIKTFNTPGALLYSDSVQRQKADRWNAFWTGERKKTFIANLNKIAAETGFRSDAFNDFINLVNKEYSLIDKEDFVILEEYFYPGNISRSDNFTTIISEIKLEDIKKDEVEKEISEIPGVVILDRKSLLSGIVDNLSEDFKFIANVSLLLILLILIIAFGRIELGFITFIPIFISWVWTLGIMGMAGIKFNIFNIIISSFITGLGIDYSIYIMQGLVQGYKSDNKNLLSYKTCILISVMISLSGTGVLILARHPALNSIALISIIGLLSVVLISYTFEPLLFQWLVSKNGKPRVLPVTFSDIIFTVTTLSAGLILCVAINVMLLFVIPLPVSKARKKRILHYGLWWCLKLSSASLINIKKTTINLGHEDFSKPAVIISNHQSHIDLPLLMMQNPKIIVLTTKWVWNNPLYALVIRFLDFYPVTEGYESLIEKLRKKVEEGYSVLVFPEGTRSPDSNIKRFHKGAFLLAEKLNLDIVPVILHGTGDCMNKGENIIKKGSITLKIFPRIKSGDNSFGGDYHERTKSLLRFFRTEYRIMKSDLETPYYFRRKLIRNYIYKGPVLEWYTRIKLSLENYYVTIQSNIPRKATIVDIGCGNGMLSYMLNFTSEDRSITGIDYDNDKIEMANNCISKNDRIRFFKADAVTYDFPQSDVFLLIDVLHYLPEDKQEELLIKCIERLNQGGTIIIRDADKDLRKRHLGTRYTEFFSTRFGYNKSLEKRLWFFSGSKIKSLASRKGMNVEIIDSTRFTSNLLYILRNQTD